MPIPPGSVRVGATSASLDLSHRKIDDYGNVVNALTNGTEIAHATIDMATASGSDFSGSYLRGGVATLSWSAKEPGFTFHSGAGSADFAQFGTEKSGVFNT
jgi:hypothetical protein